MNKFLSILVTTVVLSAISVDVIAGDQEVEPFAMTVLIDQAQGNRIVNGSFSRAIERLTKNSKSISRYENLNNLCVAYAKSRQLNEALKSCDAAIDVLQSKIERISHRPSRDDLQRVLQSDLSIALSNRGVLFAVAGDHDRARDYFEAAMELPVDRSRARHNLQRLMVNET